MVAGKLCKHLEPTLAIQLTDFPNRAKKQLHVEHFSYTLSSKMAKYHEISVYFLTNAILAYMYVTHRNTVTLKFKMRWFLNEGRYLAETL